MHHFSIGDTCRILSVKPHVLRYWEQEFPLLSPQKDRSGRRVYSSSDMQMLFRIRYLLYERGYTVDGARRKLSEELSGETADLKAHLHALRGFLLDLSDHLRAWDERLDAVLSGGRSRK